MLFTSLAYLFFLCLTAVAYYLLPGRFRWIWLLIASVGYYLSFIPVFLPLMASIVGINYLMSRWIGKASALNSRNRLITIVVVNVLILGFFKYFNFFFPGYKVHLYYVDWFFRVDPINKMILPLGLSYLVFTVLSYQIELKRQTIQPEKHFGYFSLYLLFFPRIAQGPIERPQKLIPQLREVHSFNYGMVVDGMKLMLWGYFKKLVIADRLAIYVNAVYNNSEHHNGTTLLIATVFFAFQIYADFSGYTDIALGSASIFGFKLTNNFNRPYFATSIKEFWNRWHISFSTWLRDYIFLPLAFFLSNRMKKEKYLLIATEKWIYLMAIIVTFAICGIWHGEGWNYLFWGVLFGIFLTCSNWTERWRKNIRKQYGVKKSSKTHVAYSVVTTFILVLIAWIFFRADSIQAGVAIVLKIITTSGAVFYESPANLIYAVFGILVLFAADFNREFITKPVLLLYHKYEAVRIGAIVSMIMIIMLIGVFDGGQFIYFQF